MTKQPSASPTTFRTILKWVGAIATIIAAGGSSGILASSAQSDNSSERIAVLETKQEQSEKMNDLILNRIGDVLEEVKYVRNRVDRCQER